MYIEKLYIRDFGGTKDREFSFDKGINILEGKNESGKSTLAAFIKFMFYGFSDKAERNRYYSWGSKSASGTLTLCADSKKYRIEREYIENSGDKTVIIDLDTNTQVFEGHSPEDIFFGVSGEIFSHTAYIGQASGGYINGSKVSSSIENILFSADENIDTDKALKKLDEARILLQHKKGKGGKIYELTSKRDEYIQRLDNAKQMNADIIEKEGTLCETRLVISQNEERLAKAKELLDYFETAKKYRTYKKYRSLKKKAAELDAVTDALKKNYTHEGFLPDRTFIDKIRTLQAEINQLEENAKELERERDQQQKKNKGFFEQSTFVEKVNENGGIDIVVDRYKSFKTKKITMRVVALFMLLLAGGAGVLAYVFRNNLNIYIFPAVAAVFVFIALLCFIGSSRQKINENELLTELDIDNQDEFEKAVASFDSNENMLSLCRSRIEDLSQKHQRALQRISEKRDELKRHTALWGNRDPDEAAKKAEEILHLISESSAERDRFALAADSIKSQTEGLNYEELKAELNGRPYTEEDFDKDQIAEAKREYDFYSKSTDHLKQKLTDLEKELAVLNATAEEPTKLGDTASALATEISRLTKINEAYLLAYEKLSEASKNLRASITPRLAANAGSILSSLTDEKYSVIGIGKDLEMSYETEGKTHKIDYMSAGTRDLAYYALRISLLKILFKKQLPPAIFDESFARLDNERMDNMLLSLSELCNTGLQILIFTSQTRDAQRASSLNVDFEHIKL